MLDLMVASQNSFFLLKMAFQEAVGLNIVNLFVRKYYICISLHGNLY